MINVRFYTAITQHNRLLLMHWQQRLSEEFGGFTAYEAQGTDSSQLEDSLVIETIFSEVAFPDWESRIRRYKLALMEILGQREVLVTSHQIRIH